jgi:hypothetical protein
MARIISWVVMPGLVLWICSACATHQMDRRAIGIHKDNVFGVGMVKVTGGTSRKPYLKEKEAALRKIPVSEICSILGNYCGLKMDPVILDPAIRVVHDKVETPPPPALPNQPNSSGIKVGNITINIQPTVTIENLYYGNMYYKGSELVPILLDIHPDLKSEDWSRMVYITYGVRSGGWPWAMTECLHYSIEIKAQNDCLFYQSGIVAEVPVSFLPFKNSDADYWNNYIEYAAKIPEALARDLHVQKEAEAKP